MYHTHRTSNVLLSSCATFNSNGDGLRASSPVTKAPSTRLCGDRGTWTRVAEGLWSSGTVLHAPCGSPAAAKPGVALNLGSTPDHPSYPESQQGVHTAGIGSATARSIRFGPPSHRPPILCLHQGRLMTGHGTNQRLASTFPSLPGRGILRSRSFFRPSRERKGGKGNPQIQLDDPLGQLMKQPPALRLVDCHAASWKV